MKKNLKTLYLLLLLLELIVFVQIAVNYPKLPPTIAHHFNFHGQADAFGSKTTFVIVDAVVSTGLLLLFVILSRLPYRLSDTWINIPRRDYWLAPERRDETRARLSAYILYLGAYTLASERILFQADYQINRQQPPGQLHFFWTGFVIFLAGLVFITWMLLKAFREPTVRM